ncbi:putative membrane protein [Sanguibacter gelidistatuariae]|uniref:Putative membrane protein n=1 Tax=Sanguibacter gelidistatuariae TaxID=1814289 RepID=A0A1G6HTM4_9MICO|nr:PH domain-containing protein [Sanguibacter gelidistatuariae]SDB97498.1 putative membrane protein [Sanguibacter gelidistatuariae]
MLPPSDAPSPRSAPVPPPPTSLSKATGVPIPGSSGLTTDGSAGPDTPPPGLEWKRLHPVTPFVRGWAVIAVLLVVFGRQSIESAPEGGIPVDGGNWWIFAVGIAAAGVIGGVYAWLSWRVTRYAYDSDAVYVHSGILFRQQRKVRLDRLQAIDIVKPLLARFFGLAELKLSVAGGGDSGAKLGFLRDADANQLRNVLLARAAGLEEAPDGEILPEAPESEVLQVPPGRLIASLLLSGAAIFLIIFVAATIVAMIVSRSISPIATIFPALIGVGAYVFSRFTSEFNFTGAISPDGIRLRHGLLETRSQTIPPGRVQAIRLTQGLLWRKADWWRVEVNVAGYADSSDGNQTGTVLLPVGSRDDALRALWLVLPDLGVDDPRPLLEAALSGSGPREEFTTSPRSARWVDPLAWQRNGYRVTSRGLLIRRGRLTRRLEVVPHERTQSLGLAQGPIQRRLGIATFVLHSTPGPVSPRVPHLSDADAAHLLHAQAARARAARTLAGPERWMQAPAQAAGLALDRAPDDEATPASAPVRLDMPDENRPTKDLL